jgi:hypothetical protein
LHIDWRQSPDEQSHKHLADVAEATLAQHRHAIHERPDGMRQILRLAVRDGHQHVPHGSAIFGVAFAQR